jgi:hypothetical protein
MLKQKQDFQNTLVQLQEKEWREKKAQKEKEDQEKEQQDKSREASPRGHTGTETAVVEPEQQPEKEVKSEEEAVPVDVETTDSPATAEKVHFFSLFPTHLFICLFYLFIYLFICLFSYLFNSY